MEQHQMDSSHTIDSEEIPQLEEDWDDGQFANVDTNLINRHNMHSESERIRKEYTQHLLDVSDNQYYYEENPINQLQYSSPDPDYYRTLSKRLHTQSCDPTGYYPPPPDPVFVQCWHAHGRGKHTLLHRHRLLVKRPNQLKAGKPERDDKTISSK